MPHFAGHTDRKSTLSKETRAEHEVTIDDNDV